MAWRVRVKRLAAGTMGGRHALTLLSAAANASLPPRAMPGMLPPTFFTGAGTPFMPAPGMPPPWMPPHSADGNDGGCRASNRRRGDRQREGGFLPVLYCRKLLKIDSNRQT